MREAPISKNQREAEGANSDSDTLRKNFSMDSYRLRAALGLRGVVDVTGNSHSRGILPLLAIPDAPPRLLRPLGAIGSGPKNPPHPLRNLWEV